MSPTLLVIGSGPGIGVPTTTLFAQRHFHRVALVSRSAARLEKDKQTILDSISPKENIEISTWAVDITGTNDFMKTLRQVEKWADSNVECVLYNAARVNFSTLAVFEESQILYDLKTTTTALYTAFTWALPLLEMHTSPSVETDKPSFLVTSSLLWKRPIPQMFSLSLAKAAQRSLVTSLQMTYPSIHIVLLNVGGAVSKDSVEFSPDKVAEKWWEVYSQEKGDWTLDVDMLG